jgi:hypothetical protein
MRRVRIIEAHTWLGEGNKDMLGFSARLSLFKIGYAPVVVTKERRTLFWFVSAYRVKGHTHY